MKQARQLFDVPVERSEFGRAQVVYGVFDLPENAFGSRHRLVSVRQSRRCCTR